MSHRRRRALIAALSVLLSAACVSAPAATLDYVGTYVWRDGDPRFGGFSGLEIGADGRSFHALTDRANLFWGSVERDAAGRIRHMNIAGRSTLRDSVGKPLRAGYLGDSEGLAIDARGRIWVSFEGLNRIVRHDDPDAPAKPMPRPPKLLELRKNQGFEALAIAPDGMLVTMPERSLGGDSGFPVLTVHKRKWDQPYAIPQDGRWLPVGSDFGPDGWFYLLERDFQGLLGFSSRIRRMRLGPEGPSEIEVLLETSPLQYDNLEGLSVWQDGQGIRLTMISDDNFLFVQRTELVEYRLREQAGNAAQLTAP